MKIGILTFHRAFNYGAVLQCYALYKTLGENAEVIDYRQKNIEKTRRIFKPRFFFVKFLSIKWKKIINDIRVSLKKKDVFDTFVHENIKVSKRVYSKKSDFSNYDIIVIGSDQLWNLSICGEADDVYAGSIKKRGDAAVYGYAISTDNRNVVKIDKEYLDKANTNFKTISFRETAIKDYLYMNFRCDVRIDIDPTFLLSAHQWECIIKSFDIPNEYVFFYTIRGDYQKLKNAVEMSLSSLQIALLDVIQKQLTVGEFLYAIKNSKYVITSSFHGLAFSIIFGRPFYYLETDSNMDGRAYELLDMLGLKYLIKHEITNDICQNPYIDWQQVDNILDKRRKMSMSYLCSMINQ